MSLEGCLQDDCGLAGKRGREGDGWFPAGGHRARQALASQVDTQTVREHTGRLLTTPLETSLGSTFQTHRVPSKVWKIEGRDKLISVQIFFESQIFFFFLDLLI